MKACVWEEFGPNVGIGWELDKTYRFDNFRITVWLVMS